MKRVISLFLIVIIALCCSGCLDNNGNRKGARKGTAYIDDCYIEITNCKAQISTYSGQYIAVVWVDFENNSKSGTSLFFTASIKAYQNGIELSPAPWIPADHGIENDWSDNVQPGYSISTGYAFTLADTSAPVTIQICDDTKIISEQQYNL